MQGMQYGYNAQRGEVLSILFCPVKIEYIVMGHAIHHKLDLQDNGDL